MNLAVDSLPLERDVYRTLDYSGLQVHGLNHRPLHRAARIHGDNLNWRVDLGNFFWNDGAPLMAAEYLEGLNRLLAAQPFLAAYLRPRLRRIRHGERHMRFEFSRPVGKSFFDWPNWMPYRKGARSGDRANCKVRLVHSPEENEKLFREGHLDFTADTAIRMEEVDRKVHRRDTGLFGCVVYSRGAKAQKISDLNSALNGLRFSPEMERAYPSLVTPMATEARAHHLTLSYDEFYPNREICERIAVHLVNSGWRVKLNADDYYRPRALGTAKFMILRRPVNDAAVFAAWMNLLPRARDSRARIRDYVEQCERGAEHQWEWFRDARLAYPLFKMPSLYRARGHAPNPLLEVFA